MEVNFYHSSDRSKWLEYYKRKEDTNSQLLKVGIEIECEFGVEDDEWYDNDDECYHSTTNYEDIAKLIGHLSNNKENFVLEDDGSLYNDSFELITRPLFYKPEDASDLDFLKKAMKIIELKLIPQNSGTHFHIDRNNIFPEDIPKEFCEATLCVLMNKFKNELFEISKREDYNKMDRYASFHELNLEICTSEYLKHNADDVLEIFKDKYSAVNLRPTHTIEFRFFGATTSYDNLIEMLNVVYGIRTFFVNNIHKIYNGKINIDKIEFNQFINGEKINFEPMKIGTILYTITNEPFIVVKYNNEDGTYVIALCSNRKKKYVINECGYIVGCEYMGRIFNERKVLKKGENIFMKTFEEIIRQFKLEYNRDREMQSKIYILLNRDTGLLYTREYSTTETMFGGFIKTNDDFYMSDFIDALNDNEITMNDVEAYVVKQYMKEVQ